MKLGVERDRDTWRILPPAPARVRQIEPSHPARHERAV